MIPVEIMYHKYWDDLDLTMKQMICEKCAFSIHTVPELRWADFDNKYDAWMKDQLRERAAQWFRIELVDNRADADTGTWGNFLDKQPKRGKRCA